MNNDKRPAALPKSNDEFWDGAQKETHSPVKIDICSTHTKDNWMEHKGYTANPDGTISCDFCPWGSMIAGYYRVKDGIVIDLRTLNRN